MNQLDDLKNQIHKIIEENKPKTIYNSLEDRRIRDIELQLYQGEVKIPFQMSLDEIVPECADQLLGGGNFNYREYALSWQEDSKGDYRLTLTNLPHNHSKVLITVPEAMKKDVLALLDGFLTSFHIYLSNS